METNEKFLLLQVAQGERDAFTLLYTQYFPHVQKYICLFEPSRSNLDLLTQDVFVRLWEKRNLLAKVEDFQPYLFRVAKNVILNYFRAMNLQRRQRELVEAGDLPAREDTESEVLYKEYYAIAAEGMRALTPRRRKILKMSIEAGLTLDEIAAELGISRAGVKKQLYAAMHFVKQYVMNRAELSLLLFVFLSLYEA